LYKLHVPSLLKETRDMEFVQTVKEADL